MKSTLLGIYCIFSIFCLISGCQRPARVSPAANPEEALAVSPMGSTTNNSVLKEKKALLYRLIDGNLSLSIDAQSNESDEHKSARELMKALSIDAKSLPLKGIQRDFVLGHFYFNERRFIESGQFLSQVLDQNPIFPYARNLLARSFYFLGNSDRSVQELEYILLHQAHDPDEFIDALFLSGMIIDESETTNEIKIKKGIKFLESYLKHAKDSPHKEKAAASLTKLKARLRK